MSYGGNPYAWDKGPNAPHISRYFLARGWVLPGETVLDAASASCYGSHILAMDKTVKVLAREINANLIAEGHGRFGDENVDYKVMDLDTEEWPDCDVSVHIETLEHVQDLDHALQQITKHTERCVIITVPLGGTSFDYTEAERLTPDGENNDFNNMAHVLKMFEDLGWKEQTSFNFGYSGFFVFHKHAPKVPKGFDSNGFRIR